MTYSEDYIIDLGKRLEYTRLREYTMTMEEAEKVIDQSRKLKAAEEQARKLNKQITIQKSIKDLIATEGEGEEDQHQYIQITQDGTVSWIDKEEVDRLFGHLKPVNKKR